MKKFKELNVGTPYGGGKKILVLGTSTFLLPCMNCPLINTTEILVPMCHFDKVGFKSDITTQDSVPLALKYEVIEESLDGYAGVFVPDGHGPTIDCRIKSLSASFFNDFDLPL